MICQECKINEAVIQLNININGNKTVKHVCAQCAEKYGVGLGSMGTMSDMLTSLFSLAGATFGAPKQDIACKQCGYTFSRFQRTGRLGCDNCYQTFRSELTPIIKRVHGSVVNKPEDIATDDKHKKQTELERLKSELSAAVKAEEYEKCAQLRDRIKQLEADNKEEK